MTAPKIFTQYMPKGFPIPDYDWSAVRDDYDGAEDSGNRNMVGYGSTRDEAIADLERLYQEEREYREQRKCRDKDLHT